MKTSKDSARIGELKNRLAESVRICVREELLENFGHVSARDPQSKRIFVLRHLHERLDKVTAKDIIEVDAIGTSGERKTRTAKRGVSARGHLPQTARCPCRRLLASALFDYSRRARQTDPAAARQLHVYQVRHSAFRRAAIHRLRRNGRAHDQGAGLVGGLVAARQRTGDRGGKYSGSDAVIHPDRKVGEGPIYGFGDRRAQGDCCRRNAREVRQHADAFF